MLDNGAAEQRSIERSTNHALKWTHHRDTDRSMESRIEVPAHSSALPTCQSNFINGLGAAAQNPIQQCCCRESSHCLNSDLSRSVETRKCLSCDGFCDPSAEHIPLRILSLQVRDIFKGI